MGPDWDKRPEPRALFSNSQKRRFGLSSVDIDLVLELATLDSRAGIAPLQTCTILSGAFYSSERLRAPMGPILGQVGSISGRDGVPEEIAGDEKNSPRPL